MTTWDLRLYEYSDKFQTYYEVREVFFNDKGEPWGHCNARVLGESKEALIKYLELVREAIDKPILRDADLVQYNANYPDLH